MSTQVTNQPFLQRRATLSSREASKDQRKMNRLGDLMGENSEEEENDIEMSSAPAANSYARLFEETNAIKSEISKIQ